MSDTTTSQDAPPIFDHQSAGERGLRYPHHFIIGAAKSATSHLYGRLAQHPDVGRATSKEPRFFASDDIYRRGLAHYASLYQSDRPGQTLIDASTDYARVTHHPHVAERIRLAAPDARLIYVVRHPVDRAFSHYAHRWTKVLHPNEPFTEPFESFVEHERLCLDDSRYKTQIQPYLRHFTTDQILILIHDDIADHEEETLRRVCRFFGLDDHPSIHADSNPTRSNIGAAHRQSVARGTLAERFRSNSVGRLAMNAIPKSLRRWSYQTLFSRLGSGRKIADSFTPIPMLPETRLRLAREFEPDIAWVEQVTGRSLPHWRV